MLSSILLCAARTFLPLSFDKARSPEPLRKAQPKRKIDEINNELYSISLNYPIIISKENDKLKVNFEIVYSQVKK
jgi:hypothetical protein